MKALLILMASLGVSLPAWAAVHETALLSRAPTARELAELERGPGTRDYRVTLSDPIASELERVLRLPRTGALEVRVMGFPGAGDLTEWKRLAAEDRGEVMFLSNSYPTPSELDRLVSIGFRRWSLAIASYPGLADVQRLNALSALPEKPRLIFMAGRYPSPVEQQPLLVLEAGFTVEVISKQWTRYVQMDFLNRMPSRKWLTIWDVYPTDSDLTYLEVVRSLDRLVIETDFDPARPDLWAKLAKYPLIWVRTAALPSDAHLRALEESVASGSAFQKLVIRLERLPTSRERARLEALALPVDLRIDYF